MHKKFQKNPRGVVNNSYFSGWFDMEWPWCEINDSAYSWSL